MLDCIQIIENYVILFKKTESTDYKYIIKHNVIEAIFNFFNKHINDKQTLQFVLDLINSIVQINDEYHKVIIKKRLKNCKAIECIEKWEKNHKNIIDHIIKSDINYTLSRLYNY